VVRIIERLKKATASEILLDNSKELMQGLRYLKAFGYIDPNPTGPQLVYAVRDAQSILGVKTDGILGHVTYKAMQLTPRCGCSDTLAVTQGRTGRVPATNLNKWGKKKISYTVVNYVRQIPKLQQEEILVQAWESWEAVCGIQLTRVNSRQSADIIIDASASRNEEFGTAGNVLAWAYLPQGPNHNRQLLMKFDLAEQWITDARAAGILFLNVAAHEFGHLLGLGHTRTRAQLMFPTYNRTVSKPQNAWDIPQVRARYGEATNVPPPRGDDTPKVAGEIFINDRPYVLTPSTVTN